MVDKKRTYNILICVHRICVCLYGGRGRYSLEVALLEREAGESLLGGFSSEDMGESRQRLPTLPSSVGVARAREGSRWQASEGAGESCDGRRCGTS